jgi:hypothetical protein
MISYPGLAFQKSLYLTFVSMILAASTPAILGANLAKQGQTIAAGSPVITQVVVVFGIGAAGDKVRMDGENLADVIEVKFNDVPAQFIVVLFWDGTSFLSVTIPQNATTGPITVVSPQGSFTTPEPFVIHASGLPIIESFSPENGLPHTYVIIRGKDLRHATSVLLNGEETPFSPGFMDPASLSFMVPLTATTGPITVVTPHGSATSAAIFTVIEPPPLVVFEWPLEAEAGHWALVKVNNHLSVRGAELGGRSISIHYRNSSESIVAFSIPSDATSGTLTILTAGEPVSSPQPLIIHPRPVLTGIDPESGPPGTVVRLIGTDLQNVVQVELENARMAFNKDSLSFIVHTGAQPGMIRVVTRFQRTYFPVQFEVTPSPYPSGLIRISPGTIRGNAPGSEPVPITGAVKRDMHFSRGELKATPVETAPLLSISLTAGKSVEITWPVANGVVETIEDLNSGNWLPVPGAPVLINGANRLSIHTEPGNRFFRLNAGQSR